MVEIAAESNKAKAEVRIGDEEDENTDDDEDNTFLGGVLDHIDPTEQEYNELLEIIQSNQHIETSKLNNKRKTVSDDFLERYQRFFHSLEVEFFMTGRRLQKPKSIRSTAYCGQNAISWLTGIPTYKIDETLFKDGRKDRKAISKELMYKTLREHGFRVFPLNRQFMKYDPTFCNHPINKRHVVLVSFAGNLTENTWGIVWDSVCFHNFEGWTVNESYWLGNDMYSRAVIYHPDWTHHSVIPRMNRKDREKFAQKLEQAVSE